MDAQYSSLHGFLQTIWKRWRVIFSVLSIIVVLVMLGSLMMTPIYEGVVKIIIERVESDDLTGKNRIQAKDPEFEKTQFQLIRSHSVALRVVKALAIAETYESEQQPDTVPWFKDLINNLVQSFTSILGLFEFFGEEPNEESKDETSKDDAVASLLSKNVRVSPVQGSDITAISYQSPNANFAALAANTYVQAYLEEVLDMKMDATRRNLGWMTQKAESERLKLQSTEKKLQEYMKEKDLVTLENRVTIVPEKLAQLGRDLVKAETKTKEFKLLYDKVQKVSDNLTAAESVLSISEGSSLDVLRAQILKAEQSIMELSGKYGTKHPVMIKAQGDLKILKVKRRDEVKRIIGKVRGQYELALSNENSIRAQLNETRAEAMTLNEKYVEYSNLKGEIEANRQLYDALLAKIKNQSITGETRPVNIWIVEEAKVPLKPIRPMFALNIFLGIVLGLCCGIGSAFLVDHLDNRIKSTVGLVEALDIAVLGSVTHNKNPEAMKEIARTDPRSEFAESFNSLRTTLLLSAAEAPPKKILVTSSIAGEGKTTTSVNLALTMAKSDNRVVLIDADLRKPVIHKVFKLNNNIGLSSYLAGRTDKSIMKKSTHDNLVVIPAGPMPPNPYELLNSKRMKLLLQNLEHEFDVIICDSPPILSVADSRLLSQDMNGLILVVRAGKTTFPMVASSIQLLNDVNAKILGVLVNDVLARDQNYYQYYSSYIDDSVKSQMTS